MPDTQLTLGLFAPPQADFADFLDGANALPRQALETWSSGAGTWCCGLWGASGTGKSHLLQAAIRRVHAVGSPAMYLPLRDMRPHGAAVLDGLEQIGALAIDDIDAVAGDRTWEEALFALYNRCQASGGRLMFSSRLIPAATKFALADLQSRLTAALIFQLSELADPDKQRVLQVTARARGMELSEPVASFLIRRLRRSMHDLMDALEVLDRESLRERRTLTVPFVRDVLKLGPGDA